MEHRRVKSELPACREYASCPSALHPVDELGPRATAGTPAEAVAAQSWIPGAREVKAFINILAHHIPQLARPTHVADRRF